MVDKLILPLGDGRPRLRIVRSREVVAVLLRSMVTAHRSKEMVRMREAERARQSVSGDISERIANGLCSDSRTEPGRIARRQYWCAGRRPGVRNQPPHVAGDALKLCLGMRARTATRGGMCCAARRRLSQAADRRTR